MPGTVVQSLSEVSRCTIALVEAVSDLKRERAVKRLEKKLGPWFKWQGRVLISALPQLVRYFPKPVEESRLMEALAEDFDRMFDDAIAVTVRNGEEIVRDGLYQGVTDGFEAMAAKEGITTAEFMQRAGLQKAFELDHPRALKWARENAAIDVTKVNDTTKETIRGIVSKGIDEGMDYGTIAGRITKRFGEFAIGKPQEHIQSRAHLVAVTENAMAYEHGQRELVDEIQAVGIDMEKSWGTVGDDKVSAGCRRNAEQEWIPANQAFQSGHDTPPRFPGCRCGARYRVAREEAPAEKPIKKPVRPKDEIDPVTWRDINERIHAAEEKTETASGKEKARAWEELEAAQEELRELLGLNEGQEVAVDQWTGFGASDLRNADAGRWDLVERNHDLVSEMLEEFYSVLDKLPEYEGTVYRGLYDIESEALQAMLDSGRVTTDAISSASVREEIAEYFAGLIPGEEAWNAGAEAGSTSVILELSQRASADTRALFDLEEWSGLYTKDEVILRKGTAYEVTSWAEEMLPTPDGLGTFKLVRIIAKEIL